MKKGTKLMISVIIMIIGALLMPIFGQWYEQQTGIKPIAFYLVSGFASAGFIAYRLIDFIENYDNAE